MGEGLVALLTSTRPERPEGCDVSSVGSRCPWVREGDTWFITRDSWAQLCTGAACAEGTLAREEG